MLLYLAMSIHCKILPQLIYIGYIYILLVDIWAVYSFYNMIKISINTVLHIPDYVYELT